MGEGEEGESPPPPRTDTSEPSHVTPLLPSSPSSSSSSSSKKRLGNVSLPYFSGVTEPLMRVLNAKGISTSIENRGSLREQLVKPKDQLEKEKLNGIIYHIPCAGANSTPCPGTYVGETERTVAARFQEHTSTSMNALGHYKSAMLQHARQAHHHFRKSDVTVLDREHNWVKRGIKEALYIKALSPSINIDPGRHSLSSHYDKIIHSHISPPPPPEPHDANREALINTAPRRQGRPRKQPTIPPPPNSPVQPQQQMQQQAQQQTQRRSQRIRDRQ